MYAKRNDRREKVAKGETAEAVATWNSEIEPHLEKATQKHERELWEQKIEFEKSHNDGKAAKYII